MKSVAIRKLRDKLGFLRGGAISLLRRLIRGKKWISQRLRKIQVCRRLLHLPSSAAPTVDEWITSGQAGDVVTQLDPKIERRRQKPVTNEPGNDWFFEQASEATVDPTFVVQLRDGRAYGHSGGQFVNRNGDFLWDLGQEHWLYFGALFMDSCLRLPAPQVHDARVAVLATPDAYRNFAHWVFDVLPKFGLLERTVGLENIDLFAIGHTSQGYQTETLQCLGIPNDRIIPFTPHTHLQARELIVPSLATYNRVNPQPSTLAFLREKFLLAAPAGPKRRLFISRADASFRRLIREEILCEKLSALGFESITLAGLSLTDTASLFASAEAVVGPFGSGLMNIIFSPPGCTVVEIATPAFYNTYHWTMSSEMGHRHAVYFGDNRLIQKGSSMFQVTKDITMEVDDCFEFIRRFLG